MPRAIIFAIAMVFALALLARSVTYTVRFTEKAVVTTFGKAGDADVKSEPGLKFKWPEPIQSVTKYDTRVRFLQARSDQLQTADDRQLVVESFLTWEVSDPLRFFKRFSNAGDRSVDHYRQAERQVLTPNLRSALSETSKYGMDQLFTSSPGASRLAELEGRILATVRGGSDQAGGRLADYGIRVVDVGINRIVLPEKTTEAVFERMRADRATLVKDLESRGDAEAQAIRTAAQTAARNIESFAIALAGDIRSKGDMEAAHYVKQMNENPELAIFLKNIEFIREAMAKRFTYIVSTSMPGMELMAPDAMTRPRTGKIPGISGLIDGIAPALPAEDLAAEPGLAASDEKLSARSPR